MKRLLSLALIGLLLCTLLPAMAFSAEEAPIVTSLHEEGTVPSENASIPQEVRDRTGINWQPILVMPGESATKLNALIAANDLPDLFGIGDGKKYLENGVLLKLNDLLDAYGPDLLENRADYIHQGINAGGDIYGIPAPTGYASGLALRKDWLDNLGLAVPTTTQELQDVLHAFTFDDPDKDGKQDTIGLGMCINYNGMFSNIFGAFGIAYGQPAMVDGTVSTSLKHPNYLKAMEYLRSLYQAGVIEPDFATIPSMSCLEKLWNGTYGGLDFPPTGTTNNWMGRYTEDPKPEFVYTVITGTDGDCGTPQFRPSGYYGIPVTSKNPEAAVKLANFLGSPEGDELLYFGIEGKHFHWLDKEQGTYEYLAPYDDAAVQRSDGGFIYWSLFKRHNDNAEIKTLTPVTRQAFDLLAQHYAPDAFIYERPACEMELGSVLTDIEKEALANLIVTKGDLQAEYDAYVQRWMEEGGADWEKEATVIWQTENP